MASPSKMMLRANLSLTITNAQPGNSGTYAVVLTNAYGSATGAIVTLTVLHPAASLAPKPFSGTSPFAVRVTGLPGYDYIVEASTNLWDWISLQTNAAPFFFVDTNSTVYPQRFYRALFSP